MIERPLVPPPDYEAELASLRRSYIEAHPKQRYNVAKQRIQYPEHGPNILVAHVSAVEGFARSLAMHHHTTDKAKLSALYPTYRNKGAGELIGEYLENRELGAPDVFFGGEVWQLFGYAVEYRNLLAHECTYLGQDRSPSLIEACKVVLEKLATSYGLKTGEG